MRQGQFLKSLEVTGSVWRDSPLRFLDGIRKTLYQQKLKFRGNVIRAERIKLVWVKMASIIASVCNERLSIGGMGLGRGGTG